MDFNNIIEQVRAYAVAYGIKIIGAIVALIIGLWLIGIISKLFSRTLDKRNVDQNLKPFLNGLVNALLKVALAITVAGMLGIEMTSFVAILGAAGLAIGLALSGTLQNFAGGVMILLLKPFRVGDYIEAQGYEGVVNAIGIFATVLKTLDNRTVILPNGPLSTGTMVNYTDEEIRRVDMTFGIAYGDSTDEARVAIQKAVDSIDLILKDPATDILVSELGDSSVNFAVRAWTKAETYWDVYFAVHEAIYNTFNKEGLSIPFPQMDVHLHQANQ
jgi:small conductance mechanosensitive channel